MRGAFFCLKKTPHPRIALPAHRNTPTNRVQRNWCNVAYPLLHQELTRKYLENEELASVNGSKPLHRKNLQKVGEGVGMRCRAIIYSGRLPKHVSGVARV